MWNARKAMADDTLDLKTLTDDELVAQMHDDLYDGLADEIVEGTEILLERGWGADKVLNDALVEGMRIVGIDFRDGILFVPEVLLAANAMKAGMVILRPLLAETGAERVGTVVIDTLKEKGIRDDITVLVGGAPLNEEFARSIGADAYCRDAAVAVETAKDFLRRKHNQRVGTASPAG
jgi:methanogenic corrinoid protein MtbC1